MTIHSERVYRRKDTIFIALPADQQRPIEGACVCPFCVAHPDKQPMWDTLAVGKNSGRWTSLVHFPDMPSCWGE
jgi:hypothetical protein